MPMSSCTRINNVGATIEALRPRIYPIRAVMKANIAHLLAIGVDAIGINATTGKEMTPFGQGAGIQASVVVRLEQR
jgi:2-C-methyl-D-erythritol 2,4-cyclodiphosphate synthase